MQNSSLLTSNKRQMTKNYLKLLLERDATNYSKELVKRAENYAEITKKARNYPKLLVLFGK